MNTRNIIMNKEYKQDLIEFAEQEYKRQNRFKKKDAVVPSGFVTMVKNSRVRLESNY